MKGARELLGSTIIRQGKPYKVVGITYNILGVWLQLERGRERLTIRAEEEFCRSVQVKDRSLSQRKMVPHGTRA